ncbi:MAG TPA: molybdopterin-binding oxidoreductase, partial [Acidimicrobiaceae bacterium]|nr:molybdopterin-binding oxidoreductase [Acidimicrobiaceae bacterium]
MPDTEPTATEHRPSRRASAVAGVLAGASALATGEFVGGLRASWQSPVVSVAEAVIDAAPRPVKDFAIETFGEDDKVALVVGILAFSA